MQAVFSLLLVSVLAELNVDKVFRYHYESPSGAGSGLSKRDVCFCPQPIQVAGAGANPVEGSINNNNAIGLPGNFAPSAAGNAVANAQPAVAVPQSSSNGAGSQAGVLGSNSPQGLSLVTTTFLSIYPVATVVVSIEVNFDITTTFYSTQFATATVTSTQVVTSTVSQTGGAGIRPTATSTVSSSSASGSISQISTPIFSNTTASNGQSLAPLARTYDTAFCQSYFGPRTVTQTVTATDTAATSSLILSQVTSTTTTSTVFSTTRSTISIMSGITTTETDMRSTTQTGLPVTTSLVATSTSTSTIFTPFTVTITSTTTAQLYETFRQKVAFCALEKELCTADFFTQLYYGVAYSRFTTVTPIDRGTYLTVPVPCTRPSGFVLPPGKAGTCFYQSGGVYQTEITYMKRQMQTSTLSIQTIDPVAASAACASLLSTSTSAIVVTVLVTDTVTRTVLSTVTFTSTDTVLVEESSTQVVSSTSTTTDNLLVVQSTTSTASLQLLASTVVTSPSLVSITSVSTVTGTGIVTTTRYDFAPTSCFNSQFQLVVHEEPAQDGGALGVLARDSAGYFSYLASTQGDNFVASNLGASGERSLFDNKGSSLLTYQSTFSASSGLFRLQFTGTDGLTAYLDDFTTPNYPIMLRTNIMHMPGVNDQTLNFVLSPNPANSAQINYPGWSTTSPANLVLQAVC